MAAIITINGKEFPAPQRGLEFIVSTTVSSGRNANGEVVGQVVGRNQNKANNLVWPWLKAETWAAMLQEFDNFFVIVKMPDMVHNDWITIQMYPGDRSAEPYWIDKQSKLPTHYINCKVNLIDCGVIE